MAWLGNHVAELFAPLSESAVRVPPSKMAGMRARPEWLASTWLPRRGDQAQLIGQLAEPSRPEGESAEATEGCMT